VTPKKAESAGDVVQPATHPDPAKAKALAKFRTLGVVSYACAAAGISRQTWYRWASTDPEFATLVREANEAVSDMLERTAMQRATRKGGSDTLLIFRSSHRSRRGIRRSCSSAWSHCGDSGPRSTSAPSSRRREAPMHLVPIGEVHEAATPASRERGHWRPSDAAKKMLTRGKNGGTVTELASPAALRRRHTTLNN
jgi:hypothetical protein